MPSLGAGVNVRNSGALVSETLPGYWIAAQQFSEVDAASCSGTRVGKPGACRCGSGARMSDRIQVAEVLGSFGALAISAQQGWRGDEDGISDFGEARCSMTTSAA